MREYIALTENLNFTHTAERLFITQPALSRHIAAVEAEIGAQLFVRTKQKVELTPVGQTTLKDFLQIVEIYDKLLSEAASLASTMVGTIRLGIQYYAIDQYLIPIMKLFRQEFPNITVAVSSFQPNQLFQALLNNTIDVGLGLHEDFNDGDQLIFHDIQKECFVLIVSKHHVLAKRKKISPTDLDGQLFIYLGNEKWHKRKVQTMLMGCGTSAHGFVSADQIDTVAFTIEETNGVFIGPSHLKSMSLNNTGFVELDESFGSVNMALIHRKNNKNPLLPLFIKQTGELFGHTLKLMQPQ
jgi:DNA-binding transcriptional LysR family regulator